MESKKKTGKVWLKIGSYLLTAALTLGLVFVWQNKDYVAAMLHNKKLQAEEVTNPSEEAQNQSKDKQEDKQGQNGSTASGKEAENSSKLHLKLPLDATRLQKAAVKAIPSVVLIKTYNPNAQEDYFANFMAQFYQTEPGQPQNKGDNDKKENDENVYSQKNLVGEGSGVIYTADGYIITNAHVLADGTAWQVVTTQGVVYNAEKVGSDDITDLAVLKIDAKGLPAADIGRSANLTIAEQVLAIGNPAGEELSSTVTVGYVSALNRVINASNGSSMGFIQTDTAINPGNSGGALVNLDGQVVGINTSKLNAARYEGLGFAIPMDTAIPLIRDMIQYGEVQGRVTLGVIGSYVQSQYLDQDGNRIQGFLIARVQNPELEQAGVEPDHLITKIDDLEVNSTQTLRNYLASKKDGDHVSLTLLDPKTGKSEVVTITLHATYDNGSSSGQGKKDKSTQKPNGSRARRRQAA